MSPLRDPYAEPDDGPQPRKPPPVTKLTYPHHPNSKRFHDLLAEIAELHNKKQQDYGRDNDPFANVRASEEWGIAGWVGAMVRANDKVRRLQKAAAGGTLVNEGVADSLKDIAVYALIALVLYEQQGAGR